MATVAELIEIPQLEEVERVKRQVVEDAVRASRAAEMSVGPTLVQLHAAAVSAQPVIESMRAFELPKRWAAVRDTIESITSRHMALIENLRPIVEVHGRLTERLAPQIAALVDELRSPATEIALEQFREAMRFPAAARVAQQAAVFNYPALGRPDRAGWESVPETRDLAGESPASPVERGGRAFRDRFADALLGAILSSAFTFAVGSGGDVHNHTTIVTLRSDTPVRVEPRGGAPMIERVPAGSRLITLDGGDRWCPTWPVGELRSGWIFRRHWQDRG